MDEDDDTRDDLEKFLKKVDNIESVVRALQSSDTEEVSKAFELSDKILKESKSGEGFNRTSINRNPDPPQTNMNVVSGGAAAAGDQPNNMSQDAFMRICEEDANQRAQNRKKRLAEASKYKEAGNAAFKQGKFEDSIAEYTRAIETMKDFEVAYTNRALALIELHRYDEALADCDFALRIDERNTKAMFVRAKALAAAGRTQEASEQYETAAKTDPKLQKLVKQRVAELSGEVSENAPSHTVSKEPELAELLASLEVSARDELEGGTEAVLRSETFPKRLAQLLIDVAPARNRCDLELLRNAARKTRRALDAFTLLTRLAQRAEVQNSEVLRATHYSASRWLDVYAVGAASRGGAALMNVSSNELHSASACVLEYALAFIANLSLSVDDPSAKTLVTAFESLAVALLETYVVRLARLPANAQSCNLQLLLDRALTVASRVLRYVQSGPDQCKLVCDLLDALLRVMDQQLFRVDDDCKPLPSNVAGESPFGKGELQLNKHALLCVVSAMRLIERDGQALVTLFTRFALGNSLRFRVLCDELVTCTDCVTVGNLALLMQNFVRTKQVFRKCLVDVLLKEDAAGLKRLLAVLADDRPLDVTVDWQVSTSIASEGDGQSQKKKRLTEQTKVNVAILLGKLTQPPSDLELEGAEIAAQKSRQPVKATKSSDSSSKDSVEQRVDNALEKDELAFRLAEQYRKLHAFEILHSTMKLIH